MADNDTRIHIEIFTFCQIENALKMRIGYQYNLAMVVIYTDNYLNIY